jgi:hypothetical protein
MDGGEIGVKQFRQAKNLISVLVAARPQ